MSRGDDDGLMSRWERRKAAVAAEEQAARTPDPAPAPPADDTRTDDEILEELGLAHPDRLETPDQVRNFLSAAVPDRLRRMALRRLWRLNPVLANLDGLVEYGEDYTDAATVVENMQTVYQVGRGMLKKIEDLAGDPDTDDAPLEPPADPEEVDVAAADEPPETVTETPPDEAPAHPAEVRETDDPPDTDLALGPTRRRMRFTVPSS